MYSAKNYTAQGGDKTVIGGELVINGTLTVDSGAKVKGLSAAQLTPAANQAASTASDVAGLKSDFNTLLAALKAAGLMAADAG